MLNLQRTVVDKFKIEDSIEIDELLLKKDNIISIEQYFSFLDSLELNNKKLEHFLNGVKLTYNLSDGLYKIYNTNKDFIGIGIVENKLLKRNIIL